MKEALSEISSDAKYIDGNILIVTTGRSLIRLGHLDRLKECIYSNNAKVQVYVYDSISANPGLDEIERGVEKAKSEQIKTIIGFGGGSALDAAKAIAAGAATESTVTEMFRNGLEPNDTLPVIAIPTTAGTGSELSKAAILSDKEKLKKGGLRGEKLYPVTAIVDSELTETVPFEITMETGFDVLAHAIESYVSKAASPFSEMLSEYAIKEVSDAIKHLIQDIDDIGARNHISFCSMLMGINLGNTGTALPHRLQYPIGIHTDSSHGAGLAALYPSWIKYEQEYSDDKIRSVLKMLQVNAIEEFIKPMGINRRLSEIGVKKDMLDQMAGEVTGNIANDPASQEKDIIKKIYKESL